MRWPFVAAAGLLAFAAWEWSRQQSQSAMVSEIEAAFDDAVGTVSEGIADMTNTITGYSYGKVPEKYRAAIAAAEAAYALPDELLASLLWQESRYKESVISGAVRSPKGALGIAQFMPETAAEMGIDPLDPFAAIDAAARYLRNLYRQTGDWQKTLAAYNWGIGNVQRKGLAKAPTETKNYFTQILADIGLGGIYA